MKTLKTIAVLAILMVGSISFAQGPGQGGGRMMRSATERANAETLTMIKALGLDVSQTLKVQEINLKYALQDSVRFAEMRNSGAQMDREKMMQVMRSSQQAKSTEVQSILKEDQIATYKKLMEERQSRGMGQRGQGGQGGQPGQ